MYWSYLLTAVGITGLFLLSSKNKLGWWLGIVSQIFWVGYALSTQQYGFLLSALVYGAVSIRGLRKHESKDKVSPSPIAHLNVPDGYPTDGSKPTKEEFAEIVKKHKYVVNEGIYGHNRIHHP